MGSIINSKNDIVVRGTSGNDTINNSGNNVSIDGSVGNDNINNSGTNVTINGGEDNDSISNSGENVTIIGGKYNDTIDLAPYYAGNNVIQYSAGDGNDIIQNLKTNDLIHITNGSYTTQISGNDLVVKVGVGKMTIKEAANRKLRIKNASGTIETINPYGMIYVRNGISNTTINGSSYNDIIRNQASNVTIKTDSGNDKILNDFYASYCASLTIIDSGEGNDQIDNSAWQVTINAGSGNDYIQNTGNASLSNINSGAGDDSIYNNASRVTINGEDGADRISNVSGSQVTINAGKGNDTIWSGSGSNVIQYAKGDGNDFIYDIKANDLIHITNGNYTTQVNENDLIIKIDSEQITLKDAANKKIQIKNSSGEIDTIDPNGAIYIDNKQSNIVINGSNYNDTIRNTAPQVTINSGDGNDDISHYYYYGESQVYINMGNGNDSVHISGSKITINAGDDEDFIHNSADIATINGGHGNDSIENYGNDVTIKGGNGIDTINLYPARRGSYDYAYSCNNLIQYADGDGNDIIQNIAYSDLIHITNGNYSTQASGNDVIIKVGNESITLKNAVNRKFRLKNSSGKIDTINPSGLIFIRNGQANINIDGSNYNDTIANAASNVKIYAKTGNDTIYNDYGASLTAIYSDSGNNLIINSASQVTIDSNTGNDTISNGASQVTIKSGAGNDHIWNGDEYVGASLMLIEADAGNDTINNYGASEVTIIAGEGNDSIINGGYGDNITINGGKGNDTIINNAYYIATEVIEYSNGDGNDVVENYGTEDKIKLLSGKISKAELNGNDVVITIGDGSITLKDAKGKQVTVLDTYNKIITFTDNYDGENVDNDTNKKYHPAQKQVIQDFMKLLAEESKSIPKTEWITHPHPLKEFSETAVKNLDNAITKSSNGIFENTNDLKLKFVNDILKITDKEDSSKIDEFLLKYCGINLSNEDTGAVIGSDVSGNTADEKNCFSIIPEPVNTNYIKIEDIKWNDISSLKLDNGAIVKVFEVSKDIYLQKYETNSFDQTNLDLVVLFQKHKLAFKIDNYFSNILKLDEAEKIIVNGLCNWWINGALDLIENSYGINFNSLTAMTHEISFINNYNPMDFLSNFTGDQATAYVNNTLSDTNLVMGINKEYYGKLDLSTENGRNGLGTNFPSGYNPIRFLLDREIAHELTHAVMAANIKGFWQLPRFIKEGIAELTHGIDDKRSNSGKELILDFLNNNNQLGYALSLSHAKVDESKSGDAYIAGYMIMRYFMKQVSENTFDFSEETTLSEIIGNDNRNVIKAGSGGSNIYGQLGDDIIYGGNGTDKFYYTNGDGDDVFYNYTVNKDEIYITNGKIDSSSINGFDVILKIGDGSITIKEGAGKKITVTENGTTTSKVYGEPVIAKGSSYNKTATTFTVNSKYESNEIKASDYASSVLQINASAYKKAINIAGNDNNNLIKGGKGADTLDGGLGADTLTGGKGKNTFIYDGRGSDVITDYKVGDTIQTYADVTGSTINKKNLTLTTADGGSLFIKNGKGKRITVNDLTLTYGNNAATMFANNNDTIDAKNYSMVSAVDGSKTKKSVNLIANDSGTLLKGGKAVDTLTSGTGNDTLTGNKGKDIFIYNSGDDIITDYTASQDIIMIASDTTITASALKGKDVILTVGNQTNDSIGSLTLKKGKGKSVKIVKSLDDISLPVIYGNGNATVSIATSDGSIISDVSDNVNSKNLVSAIDVSKSSKSKIIRYSDTKSIRISGGKKADTISGNSGNDTIYGNAGNDSIVGYYGKDILNGGAGNDTIIGYNGNNTLTGGKGKDIFVYDGNSNDTITDYTAGQDKVYLTDGVKFKGAIYDGKNLIFTTSSDNTLTLQNAINKKNVKQKVSIVDNGITTSQVYGESSITIANADCATINATTSINSGLTSIDASKHSKAIYIVGNNNNSTIKGSKSNDTVIAGSGANIIDSGKGNDSVKLAQNHQKSTIIYTGGNDTVTNFDLSDNISLKSGIIATASKVSNTEYVLTFKKGKTKLGTFDISGSSAFAVDSDNVNIGGISAKISTTSTAAKAAYTEQLDMETSQLNFFQDNLLEESSDLDSILLSSNHSVFPQIPSEFCFSLNTDTLSSFSISQPDSNTKH